MTRLLTIALSFTGGSLCESATIHPYPNGMITAMFGVALLMLAVAVTVIGEPHRLPREKRR